MNKQQKTEAIAELKEKFEKATGIVLTDFNGMTVAEITDFRNRLRQVGVEYKVVKNTLARIASKDTPSASMSEHIAGPVGMAITYGDAAQAAKTVLEFGKENEKLKVKGGVMDGRFCDEAALKTIASLPSREVLLSMMAGTFSAPASKMARLLSATVARLGYALTALKDKKAA